MKTLLKFKLVVVGFLALFSTTIYAQTQFLSNNLLFSIISEENKEVELSRIEATGDVVIPSVVSFLGLDYNVVKLAEKCCYYNDEVTSIEIPNTVTEIGEQAFYLCKLSSVTLSNNLTSIGKEAFRSCSKLVSVKLSDNTNDTINKRGVIGDEAFYNCEKLNSIELPNNIMQIGVRAFYNCTNLVSIKLPESLTFIKYDAFYNCGLTSVVFPESLTTLGSGAFSNCKLTSIKIPKSVTFIDGGSVFDTNDVVSIIVEDGNLTYDSRDNCNAIIETATNKLIKACKKTIIPRNVEIIGVDAFRNLSSFSLIIPNTVKNIESYSISGCNDLNLYVEDTNDILECSSKTFINCTINNFYLGRNLKTSLPFIEYTTIHNLNIGKNVSLIKIADFINNISTLETINVDKENTIYSSPNNCNAIMSNADKILILSGKNTIIPDNVEFIGDSAFYKTTIQEIIIPDKVKAIGKYAFYKSKLQYIHIPGNVKTIGDYAFSWSELNDISIGDGVESIGYYAFAHCGSSKIVFYGTPTANKSFVRCTNVKEVLSYSKTPKECSLNDPDWWTEGDRLQDYVMFHYATLKVPYGTKDIYASLSDWNKFDKVEEFDAAVGVDNVDNNNIEEVDRYDITGKLLTQPTKGVNIVKMSDGSIKKILVK